jgi:hypothetical protein
MYFNAALHDWLQAFGIAGVTPEAFNESKLAPLW